MPEEKKHSQTDLYQILQVDNEADLATIKEKYLQLALLYHPDKPTGDLQKFKDVCLAYKVLSNKKRRKEYDATLAATVDELRDKENRDVEYHQSDQFLKVDEETGERKFDKDAFKDKFEESRTVQEREEMERMNKDLEEKQATAPKTLDELMAERDRDLNTFQEAQGPAVLNPNNFDASIFNQMFNDMKSRKQELAPVEEVGEGEGFTGEIGEPAGLPAGMGGVDGMGGGIFGRIGSGGLGGIGSGMTDGGLQFGSTPFGQVSSNDHQGMFEQPAPEILDEIRQKASTYQHDDNIMHIKDQLHTEEAKASYHQDMEARFAQMQANFNEHAYMDKDKYIVKPGMLDNPLGDAELFQTQILGLDAVKESVNNSSNQTEVANTEPENNVNAEPQVNTVPEEQSNVPNTQAPPAAEQNFLAHYGIRYVNRQSVPISYGEQAPTESVQQDNNDVELF